MSCHLAEALKETVVGTSFGGFLTMIRKDVSHYKVGRRAKWNLYVLGQSTSGVPDAGGAGASRPGRVFPFLPRVCLEAFLTRFTFIKMPFQDTLAIKCFCGFAFTALLRSSPLKNKIIDVCFSGGRHGF